MAACNTAPTLSNKNPAGSDFGGVFVRSGGEASQRRARQNRFLKLNSKTRPRGSI